MLSKEYYSLKNIHKTNADYYVIFGGRSNGKSFAVHEEMLTEYMEKGKQSVLMRRWREDFTGARGDKMFANQVSSGNVEKITQGLWTDIYYWRSAWYLCKYEEDGKMIKDIRPFCYGISISSIEHDKSTEYPNVTIILFDEFLAKGAYLPDEFILFTNALSTIIRDRGDARIYMVGNTINKYCPYFGEMGLTHVKDMQPGTIDTYKYGENGELTVAVEFSLNRKGKASNKYFAFDNPKLNMITGNMWELDVYPHLPYKYKPKDILFTYFIIWDHEILQCEIVTVDNVTFTYIHRKTSEIKNPDTDLIYQIEYDARPNYVRRLNSDALPLHSKIWKFYKTNKVFFQDNECGEIVRNYLLWCGVTWKIGR